MKKRIDWLDTIRSFAIILVIIYHTFSKNLPAGFFGVDLLFLLSGFLITGSMLDQLADEGSFDPWYFLKKRLLRLFPALLFMLALSFPLLLRAHPDFSVDIGHQIMAVLGFSSNWYEIAGGSSYEGQFIPHVYLHTWSLALEFHFYLLWALIFSILAGKAASHKTASQQEDLTGKQIAPNHAHLRMIGKVRTQAALISLLGIVITILINLFGLKSGWSDSFLYFSDITRFIPFYLGAFLACLSGRRHLPASFSRRAERVPVLLRYLFMLVAAALFVFLCFHFSYEDQRTYQYGFLLAALLSACMVYQARAISKQEKESREPAFFRLFAEISYELYLFHWPLYVVCNFQWAHGKATAFALFVAFLLSLFSRYVWTPLCLNAFQPLRKEVKEEKEEAGPDTSFVDADGIRREKKETNSHFLENNRIESGREGVSRGQKAGGVIVLSLVGLFTLVMGIRTVSAAPSMLSLKSRLWADGLMQSKDQVQDAFNEVLAVKEAERKAEEIKNKGVSVIGDSVALGMRNALIQAIPNTNVDAKVSRFLHQGDEVMASMIQSGRLKKNVIIALGNNVYPNFVEASEKLIRTLPDGSRILFVAPFQRGLTAASDVEKFVAWLPKLAEKYPFVEVADWNRVGKEHPEYFENTDGVHFYESPKASAAYVQLIQEGLDRLASDPAKGEN